MSAGRADVCICASLSVTILPLSLSLAPTLSFTAPPSMCVCVCVRIFRTSEAEIWSNSFVVVLAAARLPQRGVCCSYSKNIPYACSRHKYLCAVVVDGKRIIRNYDTCWRRFSLNCFRCMQIRVEQCPLAILMAQWQRQKSSLATPPTRPLSSMCCFVIAYIIAQSLKQQLQSIHVSACVYVCVCVLVFICISVSVRWLMSSYCLNLLCVYQFTVIINKIHTQRDER